MTSQRLSWSGQQDSNLHRAIENNQGDSDDARKTGPALPPKLPSDSDNFGAALRGQRAPNLSLRKTLTPARRRERDGYAKSGPPENDGRPISVGKDDPLLAMLKRGAR